jgi:16S rRNA (cytosine967-C5)-methyltransferase
VQLTGTILRAIETILREAKRKPADAALRAGLRGGALRPDQKSLVSRAVFTLYRWGGWLEADMPLRGQLEQAFELAERFARQPATFSDAELLERAIPSWVREAEQLPAATIREFQSEPRLWLRARPGTAKELATRLQGAEPHPSVPDALWYRGEEDLFRTPEFHEGRFEIQDLSSQLVGHLCQPMPGETWWDACAGEGGKALHLCDLMC